MPRPRDSSLPGRRAKRAAGPAAVALAIAAAAGPAGCAFSVEGELPSVTVTHADLMFPPAPRGPESGEQTVAVSFVQTRPKLALPREAFHEVSASGATFVAKSGVTDLAFVRSVRITLATLDDHLAGLEPIEIARYHRTESAPGARLEALPPGDAPVDVTSIWKAQNYVLGIEISGVPPAGFWTADLSVHLGAQIKY
jgi:hypothetical protein